MRNTLCALTLLSLLIASACGTPSSNVTNTTSPKPAAAGNAAATPVPTVSRPKDGDYNGKGVVTKINTELGSVEIDHEDIPGLMPPMQMEFFVAEKSLLEGLKVGDRVDFVIRYKDPTETIIKISKSK